MNLLTDSIYNLNRPQVNMYILNFILTYRINEFSLLLKTFVTFYYLVFSNKETFNVISVLNKNETNKLPWEDSLQYKKWLPNDLFKIKDSTEKNKQIHIWIELFNLWYDILFNDPHFYIKYDNINGYGVYARDNIVLTNNLLSEKRYRHSTFLESITTYEYTMLKSLGLDSFLKINESNKQKSDTYILYGLWFFCNSKKDKSANIYFSTAYDFENIEYDSLNRVGEHYRSIIQVEYRKEEHLVFKDDDIWEERSFYIIVCDDVTEEDITETGKQLKCKEGDIHYNKKIKYYNDNNEGIVDFNITKKTEISILREVYFACRISIQKVEKINVNKNDQIFINYSYFIY